VKQPAADFLSGTLIGFINSPSAYEETPECIDTSKVPEINAMLEAAITAYE